MAYLSSLGDYLPIFNSNENNNSSSSDTINTDNAIAVNDESADNKNDETNHSDENDGEIVTANEHNTDNNDIFLYINNEKFFFSLYNAEEYLYNYARNIGFNLRKDNAKRRLGTNEISSRKYRCSKFKSKDKSSCPVYIQLRVNSSGQTSISSCNLNHNHMLLNSNEILQTFQQRYIPNDVKSFINNIFKTSNDFSYQNIELIIQLNFPNIKKTWSKKDMQNYISKVRSLKLSSNIISEDNSNKEKHSNIMDVCNRLSLLVSNNDSLYEQLLSQLLEMEKTLLNSNTNSAAGANDDGNDDDTESEISTENINKNPV